MAYRLIAGGALSVAILAFALLIQHMPPLAALQTVTLVFGLGAGVSPWRRL